MSIRHDELDSLRGLAALTVLFSHLVLSVNFIGNGGAFVSWLDNSPFHILYAGHEAVIFFFVLSGFVLTLPFINGRKIVFSEFMLKRIPRIYLPVFSMLSFSLISMFFLISFDIRNSKEWLGVMWQSDVTFEDIINHLFLIGLYDYDVINPVIWSLVHEMRISFLFPLILLLTLRFDWRLTSILALLLSVFGGLAHVLWGHGHISTGKTIHYTSMFIIGSLLAKHKDMLIYLLVGKGRVVITSIFGLAILLYTYPFWFFPEVPILHNTLINDWVTTLGASTFLILSLVSKSFSKMLTWRPIHFLGRISFSLYLFHLIIILIVFNLFNGILSDWILVLLSLFFSVLVSALNYFYVEKYSISTGKKLVDFKKTKKLMKKISTP